MLLVKTKIHKSKIHGIGLFADELIKKGTTTYKYTPWFDIAYSEKQLLKMPNHIKKQVIWYAYFDKKRKKYILCSDDQRFINHSKNHKRINIRSTPDKDIAIRDIKKGEELLCDYNGFDSSYFKRMRLDQKRLK